MKSQFSLFFKTLVLTLFFTSCEKESLEQTNLLLDNETKPINQESILKSPCGVDGPDCVSEGTIFNYTYESDVHNQNITWSVPSGNLVLLGGQGTNTATFQAQSNFTGGDINVTAGVCNITKTILRCSGSNTCGLTISRVYELNALGSNNVAFITDPTLSSGWSITSSIFEVTRDSGFTTTHSGYLNSNGQPQIIIDVPCTPSNGRVDKVRVTVTAESSSGEACSKTVETDFMSVCGTGGGFE